MADECCNSFGGRIYAEADGVRFSPTDADVIINSADREVESMANQDGTPCRRVKPRLVGAQLTFRNGCPTDWAGLMRKCSIKFTIVEEDNGRSHLFSGAYFVGYPAENLSTGEVTGLSIEGRGYQRLGQAA